LIKEKSLEKKWLFCHCFFEKKIPKQILTPILPSPRYLKENIIESDRMGNPLLTQKLFLLNCQSIRNKDLHVREAMLDCNSDIAILTETWLSNSDTDSLWVEASELNSNGLKMEVVNRTNRPGGGLALVRKSHIKIKPGECGAKRSFEYAEWKVYFKSISIDVLAIYRPPYSESHKISVRMFLDDFSDFISNLLTKGKNLIIMGDFNIHINNNNDTNAQAFVAMMEAFGLMQHVISSTHKAGNILDHIYTEVGGNICLHSCWNGDFVSDHCIIRSVLQIPKENIVKKTVTFRKYAGIDRSVLIKDLQFDFADIGDVDVLVNRFQESARNAIDNQAPEKTKTVIVRHHNMWFTDEVKQQRCVVRKCERVWKRSNTDNDWKALCIERRKYRNLLHATKREMLSSKVLDCKGDTKQLYKLFNNITGNMRDNPLPSGRTDQDLADDFANYFMNKILSIRDALQNTPKYVPSDPVTCN